MQRKKNYISALGALLFLFSPSSNADITSGITAYARGDYDKAYNVMISVAKTRQDRIAQYYLGMMHLRGQGTQSDTKQAAQWFRLAAEQSIASAQYQLAKLYEAGNGLPKDLEQAYAWYKTAATQQAHQSSIEGMKRLETQLSKQEHVEAEKLAQEYIKQYGKQKENTQKNVQL